MKQNLPFGPGLWLGLWASAAAAAQPTPLTTVAIATGSNPRLVTAAPGDYDRMFFIQQPGQIRLFNLRTRTLQQQYFLVVTPLVLGNERGLLGLAFHPDFAQNGYFWVYHSISTGAAVARYRVNGNPLTATTADASSRQVVLTIPNLLDDHNAGWIGFGAEGHLFVFTGDAVQSERAQDITSELCGKLLRIDVDGPDGVPGNADDDGFPADPDRLYTIPPGNPFVGVTGDDEIWAYGLRNPWRDDIDPATGDIFIADVGQDDWEEISFQPANPAGAGPGDPGYMGGRNYGWDCYEGLEGSGCGGPEGVTFPFLVYGHDLAVPPLNATGCSVTGGVIYRGCAAPDLDGAYFFADYCTRRIFSVRFDGTAVSDVVERTVELDPPGAPTFAPITGFGRDAWGEIYICAGNTVHQVIPAVPHDINGDHVPDRCRCPADWDADGAINSVDISAFLTVWVAAATGGTAAGDYDGNSVTNSSDISAFLVSWLAAQGGGC